MECGHALFKRKPAVVIMVEVHVAISRICAGHSAQL